MIANLSMREAAAYAGLSYDRFRKVWRDLCREEGMPAPVHALRWDAGRMAAWRAARSEREVGALPPRRAILIVDRGRRGRAALSELRRVG